MYKFNVIKSLFFQLILLLDSRTILVYTLLHGGVYKARVTLVHVEKRKEILVGIKS